MDPARPPTPALTTIIDYFLVAPGGLVGYYDRTPGVVTQGVGKGTVSGDAALSVAYPTPGVWTIQAMVDLTTSGKEYEQTVTGSVAYNTADYVAAQVPDSAATTIPAGSSQQVTVAVTNTLGVPRTFQLASSNGDVTSAATYVPAGSSAVVTGRLTPEAAPGTTVSGALQVLVNGRPLGGAIRADGYFFYQQTYGRLPYEYTVGPASG